MRVTSIGNSDWTFCKLFANAWDGPNEKSPSLQGRAFSNLNFRRRGYPRQPRQNTRHLTIMANIQTTETQGKPEFAHRHENAVPGIGAPIDHLARARLARVIRRDTSLPASARFCALELLDLFNEKKGYAYPSYGLLSRLTGMDESNVRRGTKALLTSGYFAVTGGGHRNRAKQYRPLFGKWVSSPHYLHTTGLDAVETSDEAGASAYHVSHSMEGASAYITVDGGRQRLPWVCASAYLGCAPAPTHSLIPTEQHVVGISEKTLPQTGSFAWAHSPPASEGKDEEGPIGFETIWADWNCKENRADAEEMFDDALAWGMDADSLIADAMEYALSERLEGVEPDDQLDLLVWLARKCAEFKEANGLVGPVVHEGPLAVSSSAPDGEPDSFEALWAVWNRKRDDWKANAIEAYRDALASGLGAQSLLTKAASYAEWERGTDIPADRRKSLHKWLADMVAKADSADRPVAPEDVQPAPAEVINERYGFALGDVVWLDDGEPRIYGVVKEIVTDAEIAENPSWANGVYVEFLQGDAKVFDADQLRHADVSLEDAEAHNVALFAQWAAEAAEIKAMLPFKEGDTVRKRYRGATVEVKILGLYRDSAYVQGASGGREHVPVTLLLTQDELGRLHAGKGAMDAAKREAEAAERARKAEEARQAAEAEERRVAETNKQRWAELLRSNGAKLAAIRHGAGLEVYEVEAEAEFDAARLEALEAGTLDIPVMDSAAMLEAYKAAAAAIREAKAMTEMFS